MNGIKRINKERLRQINSKGWTPEHDDEHDKGQLALAAACYATPINLYRQRNYATSVNFEDPWPWNDEWDKRLYDGNVLLANRGASFSKRIRQLEKAGALIAAEIDRLIRKQKA